MLSQRSYYIGDSMEWQCEGSAMVTCTSRVCSSVQAEGLRSVHGTIQ
jgi:hypothetical protein